MDIVINIPEEIMLCLKETYSDISKEICMIAAVKLYELGKLSSGRAAQMAGLSRVSFLSRLSHYKVSIFDLSEEEILEDLQNAMPDN